MLELSLPLESLTHLLFFKSMAGIICTIDFYNNKVYSSNLDDNSRLLLGELIENIDKRYIKIIYVYYILLSLFSKVCLFIVLLHLLKD